MEIISICGPWDAGGSSRGLESGSGQKVIGCRVGMIYAVWRMSLFLFLFFLAAGLQRESQMLT